MDYVFHDDIIPYVPQDSSPIKNRYFSEFLFYTPEKDPSYIPTDHLRRWIEARKHGLEVTSVHREVTEGIQTTVMPFYMGRQVAEDKNKNDLRYWRYLIRLENLVMDRVQLLERFLKFFLIPGKLKSTGGKGVVGTQPVLSPECPVFQYHSHTHFPEEWAYMWGTFRFERNSGASLDVKIPALPLCDPTYFSDSNKK
ncbi:unnamed protein product [Schistosoma turkestanicum]|nr:unnamed protein product [Schistosoma turkestanicum]